MAPGAADSGDWSDAPLIFRRVPSWALFWSFRLLWGLRVTGLENVPRAGAMIVAGNHVANLDGPLIGIALTGVRYMRGMGKAELYRVPILGWFMRRTGTFPVDRSRGDVAAMRAAGAILASGGCLAIMPEGTRSKDGRPLKPRAGVGFLAGLSRAPVVPVHLVGTDRWPGPCRLEARFGPPLRYEGDPNDREATLAFAQSVMDRVFSL